MTLSNSLMEKPLHIFLERRAVLNAVIPCAFGLRNTLLPALFPQIKAVIRLNYQCSDQEQFHWT